MSKENKKQTVAPATVASNITAKRGPKAPKGPTFVSVNIANLTNLVGSGNVEVRRGWLEDLLEIDAKAKIAAQVSAMTAPAEIKSPIEISIEE